MHESNKEYRMFPAIGLCLFGRGGVDSYLNNDSRPGSRQHKYIINIKNFKSQYPKTAEFFQLFHCPVPFDTFTIIVPKQEPNLGDRIQKMNYKLIFLHVKSTYCIKNGLAKLVFPEFNHY